MQERVIAIDGPSGSGKGTLARGLARHFHFAYVDTGIIYRVIAYANLAEENCEKFSLEKYMEIYQNVNRAYLRSDAMSMKASKVSKNEKIREVARRLMRELMQRFRKKFGGVILDGRDIGTVIAPNAFCKFFVTADLKIRAERRYRDLKRTNPKANFEEICKNLEERDISDKNRASAPLTFDDSYILIDTSIESVAESLKKMVKVVEEKMGADNDVKSDEIFKNNGVVK